MLFLKILELKDLIYQNVLINDTVVNANFMVNAKRPKKNYLLSSMFYLFLKTIEGKILSGGGGNEALLQKK